MSSHVQSIRQQQYALQEELSRVTAEHEQLALRLLEAPQDPALIKAVDTSTADIESLKRRIALFESALSGAAAKDAAEVEAERREKAAQARVKLEWLSEKRAAVAKQLDETLSKLEDLILSYDDIGGDMANAARTFVGSLIRQDHPRKREIAGDSSKAGVVDMWPRFSHVLGGKAGEALTRGYSGATLGGPRFAGKEPATFAELTGKRNEALVNHIDTVVRESGHV